MKTIKYFPHWTNINEKNEILFLLVFSLIVGIAGMRFINTLILFLKISVFNPLYGLNIIEVILITSIIYFLVYFFNSK